MAAKDPQLYIESILNDLMDALGPTFKAQIIPCPSGTQTWILKVVLPTYTWVQTMAHSLHPLADILNIISIKPNKPPFYPIYGPTIYNLVAKDGVYTEKKHTQGYGPGYDF